jgi:DNA primase
VALGSRIDIAVASVPQGKDPCDFLLAKGKEPFDRLIENAPDVFTFKWERLTANLGTEPTIAGKKQAVEEYLDAVATAFVAGNLSAIERGFMLNRLSSIMKLDAKEINTELKHRIERTRTSSSYSNTPESGFGEGANLNGIEGLSANTQREIIEVLLAEPKLFTDVEKVISPQSFDNPTMQRIAEAIFRILSGNAKATILDICAAVEEPELAGLITTLEHTGAEKGNFQNRLADALKVMQQIEQQKNAGGENELLRRADEQAKRSVGMV